MADAGRVRRAIRLQPSTRFLTGAAMGHLITVATYVQSPRATPNLTFSQMVSSLVREEDRG